MIYFIAKTDMRFIAHDFPLDIDKGDAIEEKEFMKLSEIFNLTPYEIFAMFDVLYLEKRK